MSKKPTDPVEAIRMRPGMYIGNPKSRLGVVSVVSELFANIEDLYLAGEATRCSISVEDDGCVRVCDDGSGLAMVEEGTGENLVEKYLAGLHDTPTADGHSPHVHVFPLGIGMIVANALSEKLVVESECAGSRYRQVFNKGRRVGDPEPVATLGSSGMNFRLWPDREIFGEFANLDLGVMRSIVFDSVHLLPGFRIDFQEETFLSRNGLRDYVDTLLPVLSYHTDENRHHFVGKSNSCSINFACAGSASEGEETQVLSWGNGVRTNLHGSHVTGMNRAFGRVSLKPKIAMISVILDNPRFNSPTKDELANSEAQTEVEKALSAYFNE